jgi:uncharacterized membrane protein
MALLDTAWFWSGRCTCRVGIFTVDSLLPTLTDPVWTSNAGACPPFAVTPLEVVESCGARAPRIWLMSRNPVASAAMMARTMTIRMKMRARRGSSF